MNIFVICLALVLPCLTAFGADRLDAGHDGQPSVTSPAEAEKLADSLVWLIQAIRRLPSDEPVAPGQRGYNNYTTQKDHWLGWLDPNSGTGTYPRKSTPDRDARYVYNRIVEPNMLLWLISASGVEPELVQAAAEAAKGASTLTSKSAAIRRQVPWAVVYEALLERETIELRDGPL